MHVDNGNLLCIKCDFFLLQCLVGFVKKHTCVTFL